MLHETPTAQHADATQGDAAHDWANALALAVADAPPLQFEIATPAGLLGAAASSLDLAEWAEDVVLAVHYAIADQPAPPAPLKLVIEMPARRDAPVLGAIIERALVRSRAVPEPELIEDRCLRFADLTNTVRVTVATLQSVADADADETI